MRRAWGKDFNKKRHITLNKMVLAEAHARTRYYSDASVKAREQKDQYLRERVLRLTGIDIDRVFKPKPEQVRPHEGRQEVQAHMLFVKAIEDRGSNMDHFIVLEDGRYSKLYLYYNVKWDKCFFVKVDIPNSRVLVSIRYNSRHRAFKVHSRNKITFVGDLVPA